MCASVYKFVANEDCTITILIITFVVRKVWGFFSLKNKLYQ